MMKILPSPKQVEFVLQIAGRRSDEANVSYFAFVRVASMTSMLLQATSDYSVFNDWKQSSLLMTYEPVAGRASFATLVKKTLNLGLGLLRIKPLESVLLFDFQF
jgi:hypothetical protein